jgi:hypothetical protein
VATSSQPPVAVRKSNSPCPSSKEVVGVEVVTIIFITSVMGKPNPPYFFLHCQCQRGKGGNKTPIQKQLDMNNNWNQIVTPQNFKFWNMTKFH